MRYYKSGISPTVTVTCSNCRGVGIISPPSASILSSPCYHPGHTCPSFVTSNTGAQMTCPACQGSGVILLYEEQA